MRRIGQGRTAEIYEYPSNQIMKLYHADFSTEAVQNEFRITEAVFQKGLPVPQARLYMDDESRKGIIFERIEGNTMLSLMIQEPVLIEELSRQMAVCHHSLHAQQDDEGALPTQKQILTGAIRNTSLLSEEDKVQVINYMSSLPERKQICHGDFHPDNVMLNEMRDQYWVIDWMTGMSGDPAGDVARSWVILMSGTLPEDTDPAVHKGFELARNVMLDHYIQHYIQISGISRQELDAWILPVAAARLDERLPAVEADQLIKLVQDRIRLLK
ncbi:phosphotransferase family protein [Paenibacillus taichungensis]|uniref:phosphotransferase family protein n=1 Tax=Paenibacillus taichungensis TaxID=484184 RepID=UPI003D9A654C